MSVTTTGARRLTETSRAAHTSAAQPRVEIEPVVDPKFTALCATVLLAALIASAILAMGSARPVAGYAVFGSALFGVVFGAFLMGALYLAITDSRRH